jgi:hypothetical protein
MRFHGDAKAAEKKGLIDSLSGYSGISGVSLPSKIEI